MTKLAKIAALHNTAIVVGTAEAWQALALALLASQPKPKAAPKGKAVWPPPVCRITFGNGYTFRMSIWQGAKESEADVLARANRIAAARSAMQPGPAWTMGYYMARTNAEMLTGRFADWARIRRHNNTRDLRGLHWVAELVKTGGANAEDMENLPHAMQHPPYLTSTQSMLRDWPAPRLKNGG